MLFVKNIYQGLWHRLALICLAERSQLVRIPGQPVNASQIHRTIENPINY